MGKDIAQIAAQAGTTVGCFAVRDETVLKARDVVFSQSDKMLVKKRLDASTIEAVKLHPRVVAAMAQLGVVS